MPTVPNPLIAPLRDDKYLAERLRDITGHRLEEIEYRLEQECLEIGSNVRVAAEACGITPYQWSDRLVDFYDSTDAFLFETTIWNRSETKCRMRNWIGAFLTQHFESNAKVLTFGDGLGFDSFYLAEAGYCVDYFEVSKRGIQFAQPMFSKYGLSVNMISDREGLRPGSYDVVVCLDVLEHVPCPADLVKLFSELLKDQGVLISHAPFWYLAPEVVTHLRSNRRHSGSFRLYREHGLRAVDGAWFWNPVVFRKTKTRDSFDFIPISAKARLWLGGALLSLGRVWSWPFVTGARALFRSKPQRWRRTTTITGTDHVT